MQINCPILRGRDIKRYDYEFADLWLITTHNGSREKGIPPVKIEDYSAIKRHLDGFSIGLEKRSDKGDTPYNLRNCAYMEDFYKPKIVWGNLNLEASYSIVEAGVFVNAPSNMLTPMNKYLLAILNSKLSDYYIRGLGVTRNGGYFEYKPMFIELLPVPLIPLNQQQVFEDMVNQILEHGRMNESSIQNEKILNLAIYELYNLTSEEIKFIENQ